MVNMNSKALLNHQETALFKSTVSVFFFFFPTLNTQAESI